MTDIVVDPGSRSSYGSIAAALERCAAGSRIVVKPGTYREGLVLTVPVTIAGEGPPGAVTIETRDAACVTMRAASATLEGLTLRSAAGEVGVLVDSTSGVLTIENCRLKADRHDGVRVSGDGTSVSFRYCQLSSTGGVLRLEQGGCVEARRCTIGTSGGHITLDGGARLVLASCAVETGAVTCLHGSSLSIDDSDLSISSNGIDCQQQSALTLRRCRVAGRIVWVEGQGLLEDCEIRAVHEDAPVAIGQGSHPVLRRCRILPSAAPVGVFVSENSNPALEDCEILGQRRHGVAGTAGSRIALARCRVYGNGREGLALSGGSSVNLTKCDLSDNGGSGPWKVEADCSLADDPMTPRAPLGDWAAAVAGALFAEGAGALVTLVGAACAAEEATARSAALALMARAPEEAVWRCLGRLAADDAAERSRAARGLALLLEPACAGGLSVVQAMAPAVADMLVHLCALDTSYIQVDVIRTVRHLGVQSAGAQELLQRALAHADPAVREAAGGLQC